MSAIPPPTCRKCGAEHDLLLSCPPPVPHPFPFLPAPLSDSEKIVAPEMVNHPQHYGGDTLYEHVKVAEALGWIEDAFVYNATKYLWRLGKKPNAEAIEDLRKAIWYLRRKLHNLEK